MHSYVQMPNQQAENMNSADLKSFIQAHVPETRLKEAQRGDLVYSLPPFSSSNASSYRSLLTALDANLDDLHLGGYGISDTTLEEVISYATTQRTHSQVYTANACKKRQRRLSAKMLLLKKANFRQAIAHHFFLHVGMLASNPIMLPGLIINRDICIVCRCFSS